MTGWIEDKALAFMGVTPDEIQKLNDRLPDLLNLITIAESHQAQMNRVLTDLLPIFKKIIAKEQELGK